MAFELDPECNWLRGARRVASPNCDDRPDGAEIDLVVVHGISLPPRCYGGTYIDQLFTNHLDRGEHPYFAEVCGLRVSAHVLIDRGGVVTQYVPFPMRAWHAGESCFAGRDGCNDFSIGIEFEGCDEEPYEAAQYAAGAQLLQTLRAAWPSISRDRIVGHSDVAPGRKTDPGPAFEWPRLFALLAQRDA